MHEKSSMYLLKPVVHVTNGDVEIWEEDNPYSVEPGVANDDAVSEKLMHELYVNNIAFSFIAFVSFFTGEVEDNEGEELHMDNKAAFRAGVVNNADEVVEDHYAGELLCLPK